MVGAARGRAPAGLVKVAAASALLHMALIAAALYLSRPSTRFFIPPVYTVDLVAGRTAPSPPAAVEAPAPSEVAAPPSRPVKAAGPEARAKKASKPSTKRAGKATVRVKGAMKSKAEASRKEAASVDEALRRITEKVKERDEEALVARRVEELARKTSTPPARRPAAPTAAKGAAAAPAAAKGAAPAPAARGADSMEVRYPAYLAMIRDRVQREWKYHEELKENKLSVIVAIRIARDGTLQSSRLEKSSGNAAFDESLLNAVIKAAPFPPLPDGIDGDHLDTGLRFCPEC